MSGSSFDRYREFISPGEWSAFTAALERPEPRTLRVRVGRVAPAALGERLARQGFGVRPLPEAGILQVDAEPFPLSETLEHWLGLFYIQQRSTALAAPLLDPRPGEGILDLCAAPGGKTAHLAELMEDSGCIVAVDLSPKRAQALAGNLSRLAHPVGITLSGDALLLPEDARFHRVLADVPCSGEGRARRDGPHEASEGDLRRLPRLQEALLRKAIRLTVPGGRILYVTCTLAPEENEAVVDRVLRHPEEGAGGSPPVRLLPLRPDVPHAPGLTRFEGARWAPELEGACRVHPHHLDSGGLFLALLERTPGPGEAAPPTEPGSLPGWHPADDPTAASLAREALEELLPTPPPELAGLGWVRRGSSLRFHRLPASPFRDLRRAPPGLRIESVGLRGFDVDPKGRLSPSGDLLRWLGPALASSGVSLGVDEWLRLLSGARVDRPERGTTRTLPLLLEGTPLGTGRLRGGRLHPDLPAARARWLRSVLERRQAVD
jgi:16S rRNA C967 or C1407 C5-methylase (RsmB/RsmF family)